MIKRLLLKGSFYTLGLQLVVVVCFLHYVLFIILSSCGGDVFTGGSATPDCGDVFKIFNAL